MAKKSDKKFRFKTEPSDQKEEIKEAIEQLKVKDTQYEMNPCSISSIKNRNNYQPIPLEDKEAERVLN